MRHEEFTNICRAVEAGNDVYVQNLDLLYSGRVVACGLESMTVEAFGHRYEWEAGHCQKIAATANPLGPPTSH